MRFNIRKHQTPPLAGAAAGGKEKGEKGEKKAGFFSHEKLNFILITVRSLDENWLTIDSNLTPTFLQASSR